MNIEHIAQIAHEAIKLHETLIDNVTIFGWSNMSSFQRAAIIDCVKLRIDNEMFYASYVFSHAYGSNDPNFGWPTYDIDKDETSIIKNTPEFKIRAAIFCGIVDSLKYWLFHSTSRKYIRTAVFNEQKY